MFLLKFQILRIKLAKILDKLYVPDNICLSCNSIFEPSFQGYVCDNCIKSLKPSFFEKEPIEYVDSYQIFGSYEGALKELILSLKFRHIDVISSVLGNIIKYDFYNYLYKIKPDIITYVPLSFIRFWQRGYNQNELILKALGVDFIGILKRIKHSKSLSLVKDKNKRYEILESSFDVKKEFKYDLEGKTILVFDDILTTGFTALSIAKVLKKHGVKEVAFYFLSSHRKSINIDI